MHWAVTVTVALALGAMALYGAAFGDMDSSAVNSLIIAAIFLVAVEVISTVNLEKKEEPEAVEHPEHYNLSSVEVIDVIWPMSFSQGSAMKYLLRAGYKDDIEQDIQKAKAFSTFMVKYDTGVNLEDEFPDQWCLLVKMLFERTDLSVDYCTAVWRLAKGYDLNSDDMEGLLHG